MLGLAQRFDKITRQSPQLSHNRTQLNFDLKHIGQIPNVKMTMCMVRLNSPLTKKAVFAEACEYVKAASMRLEWRQN
jgi:hypothetical protein